MKTLHQTRRRNVTARKTPRRMYRFVHEQAEDPNPTPEESLAMLHLLAENCFYPILREEVSIRDLITPAGGWDRLDNEHPEFKALPIEAQLRLVFRR